MLTHPSGPRKVSFGETFVDTLRAAGDPHRTTHTWLSIHTFSRCLVNIIHSYPSLEGQVCGGCRSRRGPAKGIGCSCAWMWHAAASQSLPLCSLAKDALVLVNHQQRILRQKPGPVSVRMGHFERGSGEWSCYFILPKIPASPVVWKAQKPGQLLSDSRLHASFMCGR